MTHRSWGLPLALGLLTLSLYLLTSGFAFREVDETASYTLARSLAGRGAIDGDAMYWTRDALGRGAVTAPATDGHMMILKDPAPSLLAVPLVGLGNLLPVSPMRLVMLLNPLVTALTVCLLAAFLQRLWGAEVAVLGALVFGIGSLALPFAGTFFTQPLAALGLLLAVMSLVRAREAHDWKFAALAGLAVGLAGASAASTYIALPAYAAFLLGWDAVKSRDWPAVIKRTLPLWGAFGVALGLIMAAQAGYNLIRFGSMVETGHALNNGARFGLGYLPVGIVGYLVSFPRGLLWYVPFIALIPWGISAGLRSEQRPLIWLVIGQVALIFLFYAGFEWWHTGLRGPRLLVPLMPGLVILIAPLLARLSKGRAKPSQTLSSMALIALSVLAELPYAALLTFTHDLDVQAGLKAMGPGLAELGNPALWRIDAIPQLAMLTVPERTLIPLWLSGGTPDRVLLLLGLLAALAALLALYVGTRGRPTALPLAASALLCTAFIALMPARHPGLPPADSPLAEIVTLVEADSRPGDVRIIVLPDSWGEWIISTRGDVYDLSLLYDEPDEEALALLEAVTMDADTVWLISGEAPGDGVNGAALWLAAHADPVTVYDEAGYTVLRAEMP